MAPSQKDMNVRAHVMTAKPLCFSELLDRCGDMEPTGRRILCSAQRNYPES